MAKDNTMCVALRRKGPGEYVTRDGAIQVRDTHDGTGRTSPRSRSRWVAYQTEGRTIVARGPTLARLRESLSKHLAREVTL